MIVICSQQFLPFNGGIEVLMANISEGFIQVGIDVYVLIDSRQKDYTEHAFDIKQNYKIKRFFGHKYVRRLKKKGISKEVDKQKKNNGNFF